MAALAPLLTPPDSFFRFDPNHTQEYYDLVKEFQSFCDAYAQ